jgi:hypothetical protein
MRARPAALRALLLLGSSLVVILFGEIALRVLFEPQLGARSFEPELHTLFTPDPDLGWDHPPELETHYSDGFFRGEIHFDADAIRWNASAPTAQQGWANLLFIGDSTTASLEVDDVQTIPARVERTLREEGHRVNVLNLGVRGYGTDQSVDKAIRLARQRGAREAIYLFVPNDAYETNVGKIWGFPYSKPLYVWDPTRDEFDRRPPVAASVHDGRILLLDESCHPFVHHGSTTTMPRSENDSPLAPSYLYRAYHRFFEVAQIHASAARIEPYQTVQAGQSWSHDFLPAYLDDGATRQRCADYFSRQMSFHLERLRTDAGLQRVHVVHFPNDRALGMQWEGGSPNVRMFEELLRGGVIDTYLDLNAVASRDRIDLRSLRCPSDPHFCAAGNDWIAERFLERYRE